MIMRDLDRPAAPPGFVAGKQVRRRLPGTTAGGTGIPQCS
jgi:hypothetical protein